jgi:hypothetical protein
VSALDLLWHLMNLLAVPVGLGCLSAVMTKVLWRRELAGRPWLGLAIVASATALAAHLGAWAITGREGSMAGYGAMVMSTALSLWVLGFLRR